MKDTATLVEAIRESLAHTASCNPGDVSAPVAVLWTDADGQWLPLVPALQKSIAELYKLGDYNPETRTGPVIWLRCIVDRALPDMAPPEGVTPILYLPHVSRQQLRAGGDCPRHLQPLIELQYRGAVWHQRNGRDWSVEAFLTSHDTLDLDIAQDAITKGAMMRALPLLATETIAALQGRRLEAEDFDRLAVGDPIRDLLTWISDEGGFRSRCDDTRWETFKSVSVREFGFDPDRSGKTQGAQLLLEGQGKWEDIWRRFSEAPQLYPGVAQVLRHVSPQNLFTEKSRQPAWNADEEARLREVLKTVAALPHEQACAQILDLEKTHGVRRGWVWARLGESPLALLLEPLSRLAEFSKRPLGGSTLESITDAYVSEGWRCDAAAMEALAKANSNSDGALVRNLLGAVYKPWLEESARHFQEIASKTPSGLRKWALGVTPQAGTCIVFVDGLRFDIAGRIQEILETRSFLVKLSHRMAPIPTVTATAKPVASPAHIACKETADYAEFSPTIGDANRPSNAQRLRDEMARQGIEVLEPGEVVFPFDAPHGGWTEIGQLDSRGHALGSGLAKQIAVEIESVVERVSGLLASGWSKVRIVTDHGWLLLPGGLPKVELPAYLTATKWARCAVAQGQMPDGFPVFPWHWNPHVQIVSPPGIGSFVAGMEYAHGGVSPQECIIPDLLVESGTQPVRASIEEIRWRGMRCRVSVQTNALGVKVDMRLEPRNQHSTIVVAAKEVDEGGEASLTVANDQHEGASAVVVILSDTGEVLDQKPTKVGEGK